MQPRQRVGDLEVLPWRGWQAEDLTVLFLFFGVVAFVSTLWYGFPWDLLLLFWRPIWTRSWHSSSESGLDRSVLGQSIGPVGGEACLGRPMEENVSGTCALGTGELRKKLIMWRWANTFRLDCSVLGQPIDLVVTRLKSWQGCVRPMKQTVSDTCVIVACTVAIEANHLKVYGEASHGELTSPDNWKVTERWTDQLLTACESKGIWKTGKGAKVSDVLTKIQELGGVRIQPMNRDITEVLMPLDKWEEHIGDEQLTPECVAKWLNKGPCIGRLWVCPWYFLFNAAKNDDWVYRGCGRDRDVRDKCKELYPNQVMGSHAVVCIGYRITENGDMHVLVLDNQDDDGPLLWIHVEELDALYTIECLEPVVISMEKVLLNSDHLIKCR